MSRNKAQRLVEIGVVGRPHGVRGEVRVHVHNPRSKLLGALTEVLVGIDGDRAKPVAIAAARDTGRHFVVAFDGVEERERAAGLVGQRLFVLRRDLPDLGEDEIYVNDLIGLSVVYDGETIGWVSASREQGGVEVLTVVNDEIELELPLVEQYLASVDVAMGRLEVREIDELPRAPIRSSRREGSD